MSIFDEYTRAELRKAKRLVRKMDECVFEFDRQKVRKELILYLECTTLRHLFPKSDEIVWKGTVQHGTFKSFPIPDRFNDVWPDLSKAW